MIGFFDSGKGGLTLLAKAFDKGFEGTAIYLGDVKNAPFGDKSQEELTKIIDRNVETLKGYGCKDIFCACNTASLAAKGRNFDIRFHVLEPEKYVVPSPKTAQIQLSLMIALAIVPSSLPLRKYLGDEPP